MKLYWYLLKTKFPFHYVVERCKQLQDINVKVNILFILVLYNLGYTLFKVEDCNIFGFTHIRILVSKMTYK